MAHSGWQAPANPALKHSTTRAIADPTPEDAKVYEAVRLPLARLMDKRFSASTNGPLLTASRSEPHRWRRQKAPPQTPAHQ